MQLTLYDTFPDELEQDWNALLAEDRASCPLPAP